MSFKQALLTLAFFLAPQMAMGQAWINHDLDSEARDRLVAALEVGADVEPGPGFPIRVHMRNHCHLDSFQIQASGEILGVRVRLASGQVTDAFTWNRSLLRTLVEMVSVTPADWIALFELRDAQSRGFGGSLNLVDDMIAAADDGDSLDFLSLQLANLCSENGDHRTETEVTEAIILGHTGEHSSATTTGSSPSASSSRPETDRQDDPNPTSEPTRDSARSSPAF